MPSGWGVRGAGKDIHVIARELKRMDHPEVKRRFTRDLRAAAQPMVPAVRASVRSIPVKGHGHTGLRDRIANATRVSVTTGRNAGVIILVDPKKLPDDQRALPGFLEGTRKRWMHPVYGHRNNWVLQPPHPYFYKVVRRLGPASRVAVAKTLNGISRDIT